jgi:superoxide reductase
MSDAEFSFNSINRPKDPNNLSDIEKKHWPIIYCPESVEKNESFEVKIKVGELLEHPNEYAHFIQWIELFAGEVFIGRIDLTPVKTEPNVTLKIKLEDSTTIRALTSCNLHGVWENTKKVEVR